MSSPTQEAEAFPASATAPLEAEAQERACRGDTEDPVAHSMVKKHDRSKDDEIPPPRITRPIPPLPVNFRSKPTPLLPPKPPLPVLRADEDEHPASPDMPPRPIPSPGRSGSVTEDAPSPPPRPINSLEEHESVEHVAEGETSENGTFQPKAQEDEASARRRAITECMARLGGIRFGPPMNPLSRPPLPAAPAPTSIPLDETVSEGKEDEGQGAQGKEEENEVAWKQRIAAKLVEMGGMRFRTLPPAAGLPPASTSIPPVPVPQRHPPTRNPPPPVEVPVKQQLEQAGRESRVRVEAERSDTEEVHYSDVELQVTFEEENALSLPPPQRPTQTPRFAEAFPTPPPRMMSRLPPPGRPPISSALLGRRPSAAMGSSSRQTSLNESRPGETPNISGRSSESAVRPQSEYVMDEAENPDEDNAPALPPRLKSTRSPARSIPHGVEFGEGSEMASSRWSKDSTAVHVPPPVLSSHPGSRGPFGKVGLPSSTTTLSVSMAGSGTGSGRRSIDQQQHRYHCCGWVTSQGQVCDQPIQGHDFSEHLRADHGIVVPDKAQLRCRWVNCLAEMKKESLTRHVQEKHLELRFSCPSCSEQFTRNYTMQNHVLRKHS